MNNMLKLKDLYKKHQDITDLFVLGLVVFLLCWFSYSFGLIVILSADVLKTLIEAEATILGFFGLIAVYVLTSFDNRIDRLEKVSYDLASILGTGTITVRTAVDELKKQKRKIVWGIVLDGGVLFVSFFLSIMALGIVSMNTSQVEESAKMNLAYQITPVASMFLFIGILGIFFMLLRIGRA